MATKSRHARPRRRRLNRRTAGIVALMVIGVTSAAIAAWAIQLDRGKPALLEMAEGLARERPPRDDLAARYIDAYLARRPDDARGLTLKAEIAERTATGPEGLEKAIEAADRARRIDPNRQDARRILLECYLRLHRMGASKPHQEKAARTLAEGLGFSGVDAPRAHRLAARVEAELSAGGDVEAAEKAITHYRKALAADPGDVRGAVALADLLRDRKHDPAAAMATLDALLAANPSAEARMARFHHRLVVDPDDKNGLAAIELAEALSRKPRDLEIRLAAADEAIRLGRTELARRHLDAIDRLDRDQIRVWQARGLIALLEEHADDAVDDWRRGLIRGGGGDTDLVWRLAFVLLNLGRTREASPLIARLSALGGDGEPDPWTVYLKGLRDLKEGRPTSAIDALGSLAIKAPAALIPLVDGTIGRAFEATGDDSAALAAYGRACRAMPKDASARLALIRLLRASPRPDEAVAELRRGLVETPGSPPLRIALARILLEDQARRAPASRDWRALEAALADARKVAPAAGSLALVEAGFLGLNGLDDRETTLLSAAIRIDRRSPELRAALGRVLASRGELDEALIVLERGSAPEAAGDRVEIRASRARILALRGRWPEAREALIGGLDRLPPPVRHAAWAAWGDLTRLRGDGLDAYAEWARLIPEDPLPRLFFLESAVDRGGIEVDKLARRGLEALESIGAARGLYAAIGQALDLLREPSGKEPDDERTRRLGLVDFELSKARKIARDSRWIPLVEGRLREAQGRFVEAIAAYELAIDRGAGPGVVRRLVSLFSRLKDDRGLDRLAEVRGDLAAESRRLAAIEALAAGDRVRARTLADRSATASPDDPGGRIWLARFLDLMGHADEAETALRSAINAFPDDERPVLAMIDHHLRLGQTEAARASAADAAVWPDDPCPALTSAILRLRAGDLDAAAVEFDEAIDRRPDDPDVLRASADGFLAAGRPDRAEACLRMALTIDPRPRWAVRMLAVLVASREPVDRIAHDEALALIGGPSAADEPEDRLARALILSKVGEPAGRPAAIAEVGRLLVDLPAIDRDRRRVGEIRASGRSEGDDRGDRLQFAGAILAAEHARDPFLTGRIVEDAALREAELNQGPGDDDSDAAFLDRLARTLSGEFSRSARFLDARGRLLAALGRLDDALADFRAAADQSRGLAFEAVVRSHLTEATSRQSAGSGGK